MAIAFTLQLTSLQKPAHTRIDLEVPDNVPVKHLTVALIQALHIPTVKSGWLVEYRLARKGKPLPDNLTLDEIGVRMGEVLELLQYSLQLPHAGARPVRGSASLQFVQGPPVLLDRLGKQELLIGRADPQSRHKPDIDLSLKPGGKRYLVPMRVCASRTTSGCCSLFPPAMARSLAEPHFHLINPMCFAPAT